MKKTSNKHYQLNEIGQRDDIDSFSPNCICNELWLKQITFHANGIAHRVYNDEVWEDKWTKGFLLDCKKSTASAYILKTINKKQYLFIEWKMGNYYVFLR